MSPTRTTASSPTPGRMQPRAPTALGRYRLHSRLGSGGFGTVWLARDERLERDVAVKVLPRERIVGGRFEREARAAARLSHPGIVTLYEAAVDDEGAYLVSELVRGATLAQLLDAGRLSDRDIVEIGISLCDALGHAHAHGVVHRDVKPSNVLVPERPSTPAQIAKLTDFGVARVIGGDSLTRTGDVIGTAAYMAPEQAEGREAGALADLYSLALVLYEALTGVNPVAVGTAAQRARRLGAHLAPLRRQRRELPRDLGRAIDLALRPRPRERGSIEELRAGLLNGIDEVEDRPGIVERRWPARGRPLGDGAQADRTAGAEAPPLADHTGAIADEPRATIAWPERALAGLATCATAGWLAADVIAPAPVAPATAALIAGLAVAALPRIGWLAVTLVTVGLLSSEDRVGAALLVLLAALVPTVLLLRRPSRWPLAAGAPALGLVGLAGAWPALAGRAGSPWQRAALGACGWVWLTAAAVLGGHALYTRLVPGVPGASVWMPSPYETADRVLAPLVSSGVLVPAVVWGLAAVALPWATRDRALGVQVVLVTVWAAALASATTTVLRITHGGVVAKPHAVVAGAAAGGIAALLPALVRRWRLSHRPPANTGGLA